MTETPYEAHPAKVCAVCFTPLDYLVAPEDRTPSGGQGRYVHVDQEYGQRDHLVVPIDPTEISPENINPKCDFCLAEHATEWTVVTKPFILQISADVVRNYSSLWAACTPCKDLIEAKEWRTLVHRSADAQLADLTVVDAALVCKRVESYLRVLYYHVNQNLVTIRQADILSDSMERTFAPIPKGM